MGWAVLVGTAIVMAVLGRTVSAGYVLLAMVGGVAVYIVLGVAREMKWDRKAEEKS